MLVLLYYLSQKPDFHEKLKPLMGELKNSEQMLSFLNDLSKFAQVFSGNGGQSKEPSSQASKTQPPPKDEKKQEQYTPAYETDQEKNKPQSPTSGIADDFIEQILEGYLKKR